MTNTGIVGIFCPISRKSIDNRNSDKLNYGLRLAGSVDHDAEFRIDRGQEEKADFVIRAVMAQF